MEHSLPTPDPDSPSPSNLSLQSGSSNVTLRKYAFSTQCVTVESPDASHKDQYNASSVPIYQTATFKGIDGSYDYSRSGNPTRSHLEHHLAKISGAKHAFAVSSGMAALDVITRMLKVGDEVISGDDLYGGTNRLLTYLKEHGGVKVHHVDTTVPSSLLPFLNDKTAMVLLENPTNPLLKIADIPIICELVKERAPQAVIVVDNTMMSPYLQRPLELGADVVYDSGTKYLSGHHDLMAGIVVCDRDDLAKQIAFVINASGNALTPFDAFLLLRGTKTLAIRMDRQQSTAQLVASYLHQLHFVVHYPGLAHHPHRAVHFTSASGAGAVLSFETGSKALSEAIVRGTRLWGISVSFGAVNSLISMPCAMSHASIPAEQRKERGLPEDLIRLCVGIEDPRDLMSDLEGALLRAGALREEDLSVGDGDGVGGYVRILPSGPGRAVSRAVEKLRMDEKVEVDTLQQGIDRGELSSKAMEKGFLVSAPGKVILFGEHAVVHGVTAIAAAVDLRCYALTTPLDTETDKLTLTFPELGNFKHTWSIESDLPWDSVSKSHSERGTPELDERLLDAILSSPRAIPESLRGEDHSSTLKRNASLAFLYLYIALCGSKQKRPSLEFTTRSTLPLGAGLGSSASYSTCLAASFLLVNGDISSPPTSSTSEIVNKWAFIGEKILHGNPSGVDNAVAVHGGGMSFQRAGFGREGGMEGIKGFKSIALLLTDTKVGRNTKTLVAGVAARKEKEPELINGLMDSIQGISDRAKAVLMDPSISRERLISELEECINENHAHLAEMGVSHPALEKVREITRKAPFGLSTKLTGAGGGGCAVTLLPDGFDSALLSKLQDELRSAGFQPYLTSVGGPGFGVFESNQAQHADGDSKVTPPTVKDKEVVSLASAFETQSQRDVAGFGSHEGTWIYA